MWWDIQGRFLGFQRMSVFTFYGIYLDFWYISIICAIKQPATPREKFFHNKDSYNISLLGGRTKEWLNKIPTAKLASNSNHKDNHLLKIRYHCPNNNTTGQQTCHRGTSKASAKKVLNSPKKRRFL
jgi:hypothetical protein